MYSKSLPLCNQKLTGIKEFRFLIDKKLECFDLGKFLVAESKKFWDKLKQDKATFISVVENKGYFNSKITLDFFFYFS